MTWSELREGTVPMHRASPEAGFVRFARYHRSTDRVR